MVPESAPPHEAALHQGQQARPGCPRGERPRPEYRVHAARAPLHCLAPSHTLAHESLQTLRTVAPSPEPVRAWWFSAPGTKMPGRRSPSLRDPPPRHPRPRWTVPGSDRGAGRPRGPACCPAERAGARPQQAASSPRAGPWPAAVGGEPGQLHQGPDPAAQTNLAGQAPQAPGEGCPGLKLLPRAPRLRPEPNPSQIPTPGQPHPPALQLRVSRGPCGLCPAPGPRDSCV